MGTNTIIRAKIVHLIYSLQYQYHDQESAQSTSKNGIGYALITVQYVNNYM